MRSDEVRKSNAFTKLMRYIGSYDDNNYTVYQFEDESGNIGLHYQLLPEVIKDKKAATMAKLFTTKMSKVDIDDICLVKCVCREIHERQYDNSVFYLNIDSILKPLSKYKTITKYYNGVLTDFAVEEHIQDWSEISK